MEISVFLDNYCYLHTTTRLIEFFLKFQLCECFFLLAKQKSKSISSTKNGCNHLYFLKKQRTLCLFPIWFEKLFHTIHGIFMIRGLCSNTTLQPSSSGLAVVARIKVVIRNSGKS